MNAAIIHACVRCECDFSSSPLIVYGRTGLFHYRCQTVLRRFCFCFSQFELRVTRWRNNATSYECSGWQLGYHLELRVSPLANDEYVLQILAEKSGSGFRASDGNSSSRLKSLRSIKTCATKCSPTEQNAFILSRQQLISWACAVRAHEATRDHFFPFSKFRFCFSVFDSPFSACCWWSCFRWKCTILSIYQ